MNVTPETVRREQAWILERADDTVETINAVRKNLGAAFDVQVESVSSEEYEAEVAAVFEDGDRAVNVAALVSLLRDLDVEADYPGFVIDEYLGRRLAATIAGGEPSALLAEATFHYADVTMDPGDEGSAGMDDLEAALAAGFQTRLPGWPWRESTDPFDRSL